MRSFIKTDVAFHIRNKRTEHLLAFLYVEQIPAVAHLCHQVIREHVLHLLIMEKRVLLEPTPAEGIGLAFALIEVLDLRQTQDIAYLLKLVRKLKILGF